MICKKYYLADILRVCEIKDLIWVMRFQSPLVYNVFLVLLTIFHFELEKFISKICKYISFYQKCVHLGMVGRKVIYVRCINCSYNNVVSVSLIKKHFSLYRTNLMGVRAFERYIPLSGALEEFSVAEFSVQKCKNQLFDENKGFESSSFRNKVQVIPNPSSRLEKTTKPLHVCV